MRMKQWNGIGKLGALVLGALVLLASGGASGQEAKRNVLLYVVDDQGTNDAGCYGNPVIRTPGLDYLAKHGTRMDYAFCTTPSCSSSRSTILTGMHNHANGLYGLQHNYHHFQSFDGVKSLPVLLGEEGYRTLSVGKFHVAPREAYRFDNYIARGSPKELADACEPLIASESDRPFFLYFCTTEPHRPFRRAGSQEIDPKDVLVPPYLPDTPESRAELARYYMSVERADSGLKQLIDLLQETGRWEDTLIVYVSDNGIAFPGAKTNLYEPGVRLPCVVRNPLQNSAGNISNAMVTYVDLAPTIMEFAGVGFEHGQFQGRSFLNVLDATTTDDWDEVYLSHTFHEVTMYYPMRVVRGRRYKLIWNLAHGLEFPFASDLYGSETWQGVLTRGDEFYGRRSVEAYLRRAEFELYDLEQDPHETRNLAPDAGHADLLAAMQKKLRNFQERTNDPWVIKWTHE